MLKKIYCPTLIIFLQLCFGTAVAQETITVKGKVLDRTGMVLPGASIVVLNENQGAVADFDGEFEIECASDAILAFSYIGFTTQEIPVNGRDYMEVTLEPSTTVMDEVVVVGYGKQKRANLTGAVSSVDYGDQALTRPTTTAAGVLSGLSPGLMVQQSSGKPGDEGVMLRIRGVGTLNNSAPLVIVDGFESTIGNVNPDDIESVSILKDAASSAIYGNRAANGVILITTKTGDSKPVVSYSSITAVNTPQNYLGVVSNYADYMSLINESAENVDVALPFSQAMIDLWREKEKVPHGISESGYPNYVAYPNTDWMKSYFQNSIYQKHNLSISGSSGGTNYLLSMSYMDNPGVIENSGMEKYSMRANISSKISDWLTVGTKLWGYESQREMNDLNGGSFNFLSRGVPGIYPYFDGKYGWMENPEQSANSRNNLYFANRSRGDEKNFYTNTTLFANFTLPHDIKFNTSFNYSKRDGGYKYNSRTLDAFSFRTGEWTYFYQDLNALFLRVRDDEDFRRTFQNTLSWDGEIAQKHHISALLGYETMYANSSYTFVEKNGFLDEQLTELNSVNNMVASTGGQTDFATNSFFGRLQYGYDDRYLFEANIRYDGSSRFAKESRWGVFPSLSAGWRISQESFMENSGVNDLKLRGSWGKLGNHSIGNYDYQATYDTGTTYSFGGTQVPGLVSSLSNNLLEWETTTMTNIGLELGIFDNRLRFESDAYHKVTDGILFRAPVFASVGVKSPPYQNIAEVTNTGLDLNLSWRDKIEDFNYSVSANFNANHNRVTKLKGPLRAGWVSDDNGNRSYRTNIGDVATVVDNTRRTMEGKLINEYYLLDTYSGNGSHFLADGSVNPEGGPSDGMIRTQADMQWLEAMMASGNTFLPNQSIGKKGIWYGDYIYDDVNGNGVYGDDNDYRFQDVSMTPKYSYGLQLNMDWKGFNLSMLWAGAGGHSIYWRYAGFNSYSTRADLAINKEIAYDHYFYDPGNPDDPRTNLGSKHGRLTMNYGSEQNGGTNYSNLWLYKADFLKLRNLTLGYKLQGEWLERANLHDLYLFVSGENLLTITDYPGMDPEFTDTMNYYANPKQFSLGVNIKF